MKKYFKLSIILLLSLQVIAQKFKEPVSPKLPKGLQTVEIGPRLEKKYIYQTVPNDPLNARIYKLDNGLTVYMTVYKNAPRIQTYIAISAGSKNDPKNATGLAHYLEHMVFKGTDKYGSKDYSKEEPLLNDIENLYEVYRKTTDTLKRKEIYHKIDSVSGVAAKYAIANEYDKMLSSIGAQGTNAYTWMEQTVYVNDIPSNQIDKWLTIESERFRKPVLRLFHTELEAVYEEKNRGLDNDGIKAWEALFEGLWQKHPYGTQTTIGTIDHLKNPSLTEIKKFYNSWYVPNNMAICLSGDFDPDSLIKKIDQKFSVLQNKPIPDFTFDKEEPITKPIVKEVYGPESENISIGFRFEGGAGTKDADMISLISRILYNNKAGLMDLNLNQQQKVLSSNSFEIVIKDYSAHILSGEPKQEQTLDQVKDLILSQIELIKKGVFPDWLLPAIINDLKLQQIKDYESNASRANAFVSSFILHTSWESEVDAINRLSKITKQDIVNFAKEHYNNNYVVVYKRTGEDKNVQKVTKPHITPVEVNRNEQSPFVKDVLTMPVKEVEPVFVDYAKDIKTGGLKSSIPLYYNENKENALFNLYYVFDMGSNNDKKLPIAINYLEYLGTSKLTPAQVKEEFYKLGCSYGVYSSDDRVYVSLSGLSENFDKGLTLFENFLADVQANKEALTNMVSDIIKTRSDNKLNKQAILWDAMYSYGVYGPKSPNTNILSEKELKELKPAELISIIKNLNSFEHHVLYYGPKQINDIITAVNKLHKIPEKLKPVPAETQFVELESGNNVYVVDFDMKQAEIIMLSKEDLYNKDIVPYANMFNEYFGGGMSSVVFQEMRESKALAYSVYASYASASKKNKADYIFAYMGTQADKLPETMAGMMELMTKMPESENSFNAAKDAVIQKIRSKRITKTGILFSYENAKQLGLDYDIRKDTYEKAHAMLLADLKSFHEKHIKNRKYTILVLGKKEKLDIKTLEKYGKVTFLTLTDVFGY